MKKLKFRIWDSQLKQFLYQLPEKHHLELRRFSVQQFTGLTDKQGKEIYEGDIVIKESKWHKKPSEIKWSKFNNGWNFRECNKDKLEVIGNIYESKHLLDNIDTKKIRGIKKVVI